METLALLLIALAGLAYGLVSGALAKSIITGPMVFTAVVEQSAASVPGGGIHP